MNYHAFIIQFNFIFALKVSKPVLKVQEEIRKHAEQEQSMSEEEMIDSQGDTKTVIVLSMLSVKNLNIKGQTNLL